VSAQDYYPFGMLQPGRTFNAGGYRYGFNGQEKSTEINVDGNSTTAEFWQYDARIGRRWNIDPVSKEYESPYASLANSPISIVDPNGADTLTFTRNTTVKKEVKMKSALDGTSGKIVSPASVTETGSINIAKADGPDVFYYQHNTTTID